MRFRSVRLCTTLSEGCTRWPLKERCISEKFCTKRFYLKITPPVLNGLVTCTSQILIFVRMFQTLQRNVIFKSERYFWNKHLNIFMLCVWKVTEWIDFENLCCSYKCKKKFTADAMGKVYLVIGSNLLIFLRKCICNQWLKNVTCM